MTPKSTLLRYLLLPAICIQTVSAFCYSPDGRTLTARPDIVPCNIIQGSTSMCCKTNVTKAADADVCMPNGLCRESSTQPHYWRNDCSDPTFPSAHCIKACSSNATALDSSGNIRMTPCDGTPTSTDWCCGTTTDCCGTSDVVVLAAVVGDSTSSSVSSTSPTSTSSNSINSSTSTSSTSSSSSTGSTTPAASTGLSTGAKAGVGIGAAVGALAVLGGSVFYFLRRKKTAPKHDLAAPEYSDVVGHDGGSAAAGQGWQMNDPQKVHQQPAYGGHYNTQPAMVERQELEAIGGRQELQ